MDQYTNFVISFVSGVVCLASIWIGIKSIITKRFGVLTYRYNDIKLGEFKKGSHYKSIERKGAVAVFIGIIMLIVGLLAGFMTLSFLMLSGV